MATFKERATEMSYEERLMAAATIILESYSRGDGKGDATAPFSAAEIGVTATLKPHQVEGISWLIRRYHLGVNVILDGIREDFTSNLFLKLFESSSKLTWTIFGFVSFECD